MIYLIVFAVVVLTLVAGFWYYGRKPAIHRHLTDDELVVLLRVLLNQGNQGGVLFIRGRKKTPFVQVMKYIGSGRVGLQLDFPKAPWSQAIFPRAETILQDFDAKTTGGWTERRNDMQFITVDFGTDIERAKDCVKALAEIVLGIELVREGRAHFENVSLDPNARIGFV